MARHTRPGMLANFVKGKLIDTIQNVCSTLNWVVSCIDGLTPGRGISITNVNSGRPTIGVDIQAGDGIEISDAGGDFSKTLKISATGGGGGGEITSCVINSGSSSNVVGSASISGGVLTITLDVYYV